jgi:drug/metabolite transporter (DMT)-like permease
VAWRGWLAFVALGIIWGLPYFFIRIALQEVPPLALALAELLATLVLLPIAWLQCKHRIAGLIRQE